MEKNYKKSLSFFFKNGIKALVLLLLITMQMQLHAQGIGKPVKGRVTDEANLPLPGVTVNIKGTNRATATDANGNFSIISANSTDVLVFRFLGSQTKEVSVGDGSLINVTLINDSKLLKDVVVIGYGTSSKADVTGSITSLKAEDFNVGVTTTPAELLQGKVAGLNISKSGDPNQAPTVVLRGPSNVRNTTTQDAFYVIDGVPGASIDLLAPSDIESIDVLKDASSTAIYGSRAANGVIFVTTKKAKAGQNRLSYSSYVSVDQVSKKIDMLTGDQLRAYLAANKQAPLSMPLNDDGSNTNWQNLVERNGFSQNHNLSYNGATNNAEYGASVNYFDNEGVIKRTSLERTIYRGYVNQRYFNDHLKLSLNLTNSNSNGSDVAQTYLLPGMLFYLPTVSPFNPDGTYKENYTRTGSGPLNPLSLLNNNIISTNDNKTLINGIVQVDIVNGLKFTLSGSQQRDQYNYNSYLNSASGLAVGANGVAHRASDLNTNNIVEGYFNYDKKFGQHSLKLLAGYTYQENKTNDGFGVQTQNFSNDNLSYNNLFLSNPSSLSQIAFDNNPISTLRLISYYARVQYQFADKYLLQGSLRDDGSSAFGANHRYGLFPAVSAGWRIINEDFMKNATAFSDLKLRVGYGVSGNSDGFNAFTAQQIYGTQSAGSKFVYNGNVINSIGAVRNPNPNLKWESTATTNIGLDFGLFKNRITGSVDYYDKQTSDLIYENYPVSLTQYLYPYITANAGKIKNTGIEVVINATPVAGAFTWRTSFNIAHNHNVIESLSGGQFNLPVFYTAQLGGKGQSGNYSQIVKPGVSVGTFYLYHYVGKNAAGVSEYLNASNQVISTQPLTTDERIAGNAQPNVTFGFTNTFYYKNFDFNFLLRGVAGNKVLNATLAGLNDPADAKIQNIPRFTQGESYNDINAYLISDRYLESGSYLRLDNATLGYTIKPKIQAIKSIRLYVSGSNLFIVTGYRGLDPEVNVGGLTPGIDNQNYYPKTRTYLFGLTASF